MGNVSLGYLEIAFSIVYTQCTFDAVYNYSKAKQYSMGDITLRNSKVYENRMGDITLGNSEAHGLH